MIFLYFSCQLHCQNYFWGQNMIKMYTPSVFSDNLAFKIILAPLLSRKWYKKYGETVSFLQKFAVIRKWLNTIKVINIGCKGINKCHSLTGDFCYCQRRYTKKNLHEGTKFFYWFSFQHSSFKWADNRLFLSLSLFVCSLHSCNTGCFMPN